MGRMATRAALVAVVAIAATGGAVLAASGERDRHAQRGAGTWASTLEQSPFKRSEVGAARIGDRIYVVGGYLASGRTVRRMAAYDISEDAWHELPGLPRPANHPGVTALRGKLYVLGGQRGAANHASDDLWRYSPASRRWKRLPDAPTARAAMGFAAGAGKLYAAGGQASGNFELRRLEVYDLSRRRWRRRTPMPTGRNHLTAVFARGAFWAIGGRRPGGNLATVERYRPATSRWKAAPALNVARGGTAAAVARRSIVVFGGEDLGAGGATIAEVERLPLASGNGPWQLIEPMPMPRHGLGAAAKGGFVYALEGGTEPGLSVSNLVERLALSD